MAVIIKTKRSNSAGSQPAPTDLEEGELAVNLADRKLYTKDTHNMVIPLGANGVQVYKQAAAPTIASDGDFWIKTP
jgi:hypothetical protein